MLLEGSGTAPDITAHRGYRTGGRAGVPEAFKDYQRRPGLLISVNSPTGRSGYRLRPDRPRRGKDGKLRKYEQPARSPNMIDVHPSMHEAARDPSRELWVTEGENKADSLTSRGCCTVALFGVWGYAVPGTHGRELLPCWDHVALEGRDVRVVFDSDVVVKPGVQLALERLVGTLEARGARVLVVYLPDAEDGSKVGADDYLVAGGTVEGLRALAHPFEPGEAGRIRLSRDEELRADVGVLRRRWWGTDWARMVGTGERPNSMRGHTMRDLEHALIGWAARSGRVVEDGVLVEKVATRTLAEETATSRQTVMKALRHLEADSRLRRVEGDGAADEAGSYVLLTGRVTLDQKGERGAGEEGRVLSLRVASDPGGKGLHASPPVPRLRWSACRVEREATTEEVDGESIRRDRLRYWPIKRLGKIRGAVLDFLVAAGGKIPLEELGEVLRRRRGDLVRRKAKDRRRDGILVMLEDAGIVVVEGGVVSLAADWLEALDRELDLAGELEARRLQADKHAREREAFRNRRQVEPEKAPTEAEMDATREERRRRREAAFEEERRRPVSPLAAAIRDYLERNPRDADQAAGWLGLTAWTFDLYPDRPTPHESRGAVEELGGDGYRASLLRRSREAA